MSTVAASRIAASVFSPSEPAVRAMLPPDLHNKTNVQLIQGKTEPSPQRPCALFSAAFLLDNPPF
jgi:hypothetical protein